MSREIDKDTLKKYLKKPWYLHPLTISLLFAGWILIFIPTIIAIILLIVDNKDTKRKRQIVLDLNLDKMIELDVLEKSIKQKTIHDKALDALAGIKAQYAETKASLELIAEQIKEKTEHDTAIATLAGTRKVLKEQGVRYAALLSAIEEKSKHDKALTTIAGAAEEFDRLKARHDAAAAKLKKLEDQIIEVESELDVQEVGFYGIDFDVSTSAEYKAKIIELQDKQKRMVKEKTACDSATNFTYNGSLTEGRKMVNRAVKMALWSFNTHSDSIVTKVTYRNRDLSERKIRRAFEIINSNDDVASINYKYLALKLEELKETHNYKEQLEHEKELLREQREQEREEKKLQQEIARERAKIEKDETHISTELARLQKLLLQERSDKESLKTEMNRLESKMQKLNKRKQEVDYRENNAKAGYVYVISNIGAFGEGMIKIGVTRRLEPLERVNELGDASVPFRFDIHALIFSDQAYKLESALHDRFSQQRVNQVNGRKEFFRVPLEDVRKAIVEEFKGSSVEFHMQPDAKEFRQSVAMKKARPGEATRSSVEKV